MKVWTLVLLSSIAYADTAGLLAPTLHPIDTPAQPTSNSPTDLLQPTTANPIANRPLNNAGIYSLGGQIFVDRIEKVNTVIVSSASVSTMNVTGLLTVPNGINSTDAAAFGQLKVLQVIGCTSTSQFSTTSASFQTTNLTCSIKPSSTSNKVFIVATSMVQNGTANSEQPAVTLARGGSNILASNGQMTFNLTSSIGAASATLSYLDSPSTTSNTTYSVQINTTGGNAAIWGGTNATQSMALMEIAP